MRHILAPYTIPGYDISVVSPPCEVSHIPGPSHAERRSQPMIQMIQRILPHNPSRRTVANRPRVEIIRRWVETADERCPLACVCFALPEIIPDQDDECESPRPAFSSFSLKSGRLHPINNLPAPSILVQSLKNSIHTIAAILLLTISFVA